MELASKEDKFYHIQTRDFMGGTRLFSSFLHAMRHAPAATILKRSKADTRKGFRGILALSYYQNRVELAPPSDEVRWRRFVFKTGSALPKGEEYLGS